jgi:drug/metabolite transporter (DMT)-like permease
VALGFLGAILVLRPGVEEFTLGALAAVVTAISVAGSRVSAKLLARSESANAIVFYNVLYVTPLTAIPALLFWTTPSVEALIWLAALAIVASLGHFCLAQAYRSADISVLAPFDFFQLPAAAFFGYVAFRQVPDTVSWLGAAVIVGSALYATYREAKLRRVARVA